MKNNLITACLLGSLALNAQNSDYPIRPINFTEVKISDRFWSPRIETNRTATIPYDFEKCDLRLKNFDIAKQVMAGEVAQGKFCTTWAFDDSDIYKVLEGASFSLQTHYDAQLDAFMDKIITQIADAQEPDGYLYTALTMKPTNPPRLATPTRWVNDRKKASHELYNSGHLYEAAAAHFLATKKRNLLNIALKNADLVCKTLGKGKIENVMPGHQVIEIGLVKLYRVTGERRYLDMADWFVSQRGGGTDKDRVGQYAQDDKPILATTEAVGHAVRAGYYYAGVADVAAMTNNKAYIEAINRIWENIVSKKIHITGGVGARDAGEAFGDNYELPNLEAYNETCAAIANLYFNHRMFLIHGDSKYMDVFERTLYNGFLSGVAFDGKHFFYPNPLASVGNYKRAEWFDCSCCPTNVVRVMPSLSGYVYAAREADVFVNLYVGNEGKVSLKTGEVALKQETNYPTDGKIRLIVTPSVKDLNFRLNLRIPSWLNTDRPLPSDLYQFTDKNAAQPIIKLNGKPANYLTVNGYAVLKNKWQAGDVVEIELPMKVRFISSHKNVTNNRGLTAIQRGPVVFCAEEADNAKNVQNFWIPSNAEFSTSPTDAILRGAMALKTQGFEVVETANGFQKKPKNLTLVPYYAWASRGDGEMAVWLQSDKQVVTPKLSHDGGLFLNEMDLTVKGLAGQKVLYWAETKTVAAQNTSKNGAENVFNKSENQAIETSGSIKNSQQGEWKVYDNPLKINTFTHLKVVATDEKNGASDTVEVFFEPTQMTPSVPKPKNAVSGLTYTYKEGKIFSLAGIDSLQTVKTGVAQDLNIKDFGEKKDHYSLIWEGYLEVNESGVYTFFTHSDDGSSIEIDGKTVVKNDGLHGMIEKKGQIALEKGFHRLKIRYFEYDYGEGLKVEWQGAGFEKMALPMSRVFREN